MTSNILSIGKSALLAAQVGINTTGHNIANANVDGYSRQVVVQASSPATDSGFGFVGTGTQIAELKRVYSDFLGTQVLTAQSNSSSLNSYLSQINQIDNMLADPSSGLTPALQDFFKGVQDLTSNPVQARQALLSAGESLSARFQSMNSQLNDIRAGINSQITGSVTSINSYAQQIAALNQSITVLSAGDTRPPNDLLDQRDQLVAQLSKETKVSVILESDNTYNVSIGSGQPLVVGKAAFRLAAVPSPTDLTRLQIGYVTGTKVTVLSDTALTGGNLGGLLDFRVNTLDPTQNALGRIAITVADTFNAQHKLGIDANGVQGGNFFNEAVPLITSSIYNNLGSTAVTTASISNTAALTNSDYRVRFDGTPASYNVTRLSDGKTFALGSSPASGTIDGIDFNVTGTSAIGDTFMVRPTIDGASTFSMAISDRALIAAAAPITTSARTASPPSVTGNIGSGAISAGSVDSTFAMASVAPPITLTYNSAAGAFDIVPNQTVSVSINGTAVAGSPFAPGTPVPYAPGSKLTFAGITVDMTGNPGDGDSFSVGQNASGIGDNRNALLLAGLQTKNTMDSIGGQPATATFQGAYAAMVGDIGNKTRELQVTGAASDTLLAQNKQSEQSVSGVNLDEEAANLIRYQQAYQAAGKVMQIASQMFATLLTLGG